MTQPIVPDDDLLDDAMPGAQAREIVIDADAAGDRLDRVLAAHLADVSRARIQALMAQGALSLDGKVITDVSLKAKAGTYVLTVPEPRSADPLPEDLPLTVLYEDAHLIVVDKAAGMAAHPAPGTYSATLVNALLYHCAASLSGIGGVARPGIVHRLDKDTSGVMVAAKTDAAHAGLSALFAAHDLDRVYTALVRGMAQAARVPARLLPVPVPLLRLAGRVLGKADTIDRLCGNLQVDSSKARDLLGWVPPVSVEEGLRRVVR